MVPSACTGDCCCRRPLIKAQEVAGARRQEAALGKDPSHRAGLCARPTRGRDHTRQGPQGHTSLRVSCLWANLLLLLLRMAELRVVFACAIIEAYIVRCLERWISSRCVAALRPRAAKGIRGGVKVGRSGKGRVPLGMSARAIVLHICAPLVRTIGANYIDCAYHVPAVAQLVAAIRSGPRGADVVAGNAAPRHGAMQTSAGHICARHAPRSRSTIAKTVCECAPQRPRPRTVRAEIVNYFSRGPARSLSRRGQVCAAARRDAEVCEPLAHAALRAIPALSRIWFANVFRDDHIRGQLGPTT